MTQSLTLVAALLCFCCLQLHSVTAIIPSRASSWYNNHHSAAWYQQSTAASQQHESAHFGELSTGTAAAAATVSPAIEVPSPVYTYQTRYFRQTTDHFAANTYTSTIPATFQQKYLINDTYWRRPEAKGKHKRAGPIFFYSGNEGIIETFAQNTGFMWDIAPQFEAMVVFCEHRYYGESLPFGNDTYSKVENLQFLTSEQALADYAVFLTWLKQQYNATDVAVITFGGSYGGMLSAWFRMKYPNIVAGAIAASAPIWQFTGLVDPHTYSAITTRTFRAANESCPAAILKSWDAIQRMPLDQLSTIMRLCTPLKAGDVESLLFPWLSNAYQYTAMGDYPYPSTFLGPMPANPVKVMCDIIGRYNPNDDVQLVTAIYEAASVFYNSSNANNGTCYQLSNNEPASLGDQGQYGGDSDMFYSDPWNLQQIVNNCTKTYAPVVPRPFWINTFYGAKKIKSASNIVFTNGNLDPWSGGGVLADDLKNIPGVDSSVIAFTIEGGAHHLDLRNSVPQYDPIGVVKARQIHVDNINVWIDESEGIIDHGGSSGLSKGEIAVIAIAGTIGLAAVAYFVYKCCLRNRIGESAYSSVP